MFAEDFRQVPAHAADSAVAPRVCSTTTAPEFTKFHYCIVVLTKSARSLVNFLLVTVTQVLNPLIITEVSDSFKIQLEKRGKIVTF